MKAYLLRVSAAIVLALGLVIAGACAQSDSDTVQSASDTTEATSDTADAHIAAARAAAGQDHTFMYDTLCEGALSGIGVPPEPRSPRSGPPPRESWHAEPAKVFDNVYWLGTINHSAWAITTSDGIILMDAIFDYAIEDEVIEGLKKVGLDPANIKYNIIGHAHGDHIGGAKALQERYGTRIIVGADDWDLLDVTGPGASSATTKPERDMVGTDGMEVTLGDTTVTIYVTPGHTKGTLSSIIPVTDRGEPHVAAYWGGTLYNWVRNRAQYITETQTDQWWFDTYASSAARFREIAARAGADIVLSNHTNYDHTKTNLPLLAARQPGDPNPYVIGSDRVQAYLRTVEECARAGSLLVQ